MLYDIRDAEKAANTLERFTGVSSIFWSIERVKNACRFDFSNANEDINT